jgi:hypothetical protein
MGGGAPTGDLAKHDRVSDGDAAPLLGQHPTEVLAADLGLGEAEIRAPC